MGNGINTSVTAEGNARSRFFAMYVGSRASPGMGGIVGDGLVVVERAGLFHQTPDLDKTHAVRGDDLVAVRMDFQTVDLVVMRVGNLVVKRSRLPINYSINFSINYSVI